MDTGWPLNSYLTMCIMPIENNSVLISAILKKLACHRVGKPYTAYSSNSRKRFSSRYKKSLPRKSLWHIKTLSKEMQEYQSYIVNEFLTRKKEILSMDAIDAADPTYIAWSKDEYRLKEFLTYAAGKTD